MAREVERVEVLFDRELRVLDPRRHRVGGAGGQLQLGEPEQELRERLVGRGGIPRQRLELAAHRRQPQLPEVGLEQFGRDIGHRHIPFPRGNPGDQPGPDDRARWSSHGTRSGEEDTDGALGGGTAQELVEAAQVGERHLHLGNHARLRRASSCGHAPRPRSRRACVSAGSQPRHWQDARADIPRRPDTRVSEDARRAVAGPARSGASRPAHRGCSSSTARNAAKHAGSFQSRNTGAWSERTGLAAQRREVMERVQDHRLLLK